MVCCVPTIGAPVRTARRDPRTLPAPSRVAPTRHDGGEHPLSDTVVPLDHVASLENKPHFGRALHAVTGKRRSRHHRGKKTTIALKKMILRKAEEEDADADGDDDEDEDDDSEEDDDDSESEEESSGEHKSEESISKTIRASADVGQTANGNGGHSASAGTLDGDGLVDDVNVTHIRYMIFKIIKANKIRSVVDMPCGNSLQWFPHLLERIDFELGDFKYYCVDTESERLDELKQHFGEAGNPEFLSMKADGAHGLPKVDLVFSWGGPQQWGVRNTWAFFTALRSVRPKFLMITNNPTVTNTNDRDGTLNLRKQPFHVSYIYILRFSFVLRWLRV
ncbi:S-adenosyl-L-methionine-dependent methyltransferase [Gracilaria domingensis]|nr:S-adenosyl-L-methionine-dependent methyltransferase [Gracilaria domingensis]